MAQRSSAEEVFDSLDCDGNGMLSREELLAAIKNPSEVVPPIVPVALLTPDQLFDQLDRRRNGRVSKEEFFAEATRLGVVFTEPTAALIPTPLPQVLDSDQLFDLLDRNGDGILSREDFFREAATQRVSFAEPVTTLTPPPAPVMTASDIFDKIDRNKDGKISMAEFYAEAAAQMFDHFDLKKDGILKRGDFVSAALEPELKALKIEEELEKDADRWVCFGYKLGTISEMYRSCMDGLRYRLGLPLAYAERTTYFQTKDNLMDETVTHVRKVWILIGLFVIFMLLVIPTWNANSLLLDPTYVYFAGKTSPMVIWSIGVSIPIFYACTVSMLFRRGSLQAISEFTLLSIITSMFAALGLSLLVTSMPLSYAATSAYNNIVYDCSTGLKTRELFQVSSSLYALREDPACASQLSVEDCPGFVPSLYTDVLKRMETAYRCAGYCLDPKLYAVGTVTPPASNTVAPPVFLQLDQQRTRSKSNQRRLLGSKKMSPLMVDEATMRQQGHADRLLDHVRQRVLDAATAKADEARQDVGDLRRHQLRQLRTSEDVNLLAVEQVPPSDPNASASITPTGTYSYLSPPPQIAKPLFSPRAVQASCDGAAANYMLHAVGDIADQTFYQGFASMLASFLLCGFTIVGAYKLSSKSL